MIKIFKIKTTVSFHYLDLASLKFYFPVYSQFLANKISYQNHKIYRF